MRIAIAADHAGLPLRDRVARAVTDAGHEPLLLGPDSGDPVDYPVVTTVVGDAIATGDAERGVLVCGSGAGVTVAANRLPGVRAAFAADHYTAHQMVEHDHVNVLTLGARVTGEEVAADLVSAFARAAFQPEARHRRRLGEVLELTRSRSINAATRLHDNDQSLWLDNITRDLLSSTDLARYIDGYAITGLTSNPSIFDKAITETNAYDAQIHELAATGLRDERLFFAIAFDDLTRAAALLRPTWDASGGIDGWVSLEVSPRLAHDTAGTVAEARRLHAHAAIPNLLVKVPGTVEGLSAVEELIADGIPVNVTLLFSCDHYLGAADAYLRGLERRRAARLHLDVGSVASLFVSRWDKATESSLPQELHDRLGVAVAQRTYAAYRALLASERWRALAREGANPQRLLWASTGTKDPALPDTFYVEALASEHTINTMPEATLLAFAAHGTLATLLPPAGGDADEVLPRVAASGVDLDALAARLQAEGAAAFDRSWSDLMERVSVEAGAT